METLCYKIWRWPYISSYVFRCCLGFNLTMMFGFHDSAGLSGCCGKWIHMQWVGGERNAHRCLFLCLVQYGTRGTCSSFSCNNFFLTLLKCRFMLTAIFNWTLESVPCQSNNMWQARQRRRLISQNELGLVCAELGWVQLAVWLQQATLQTKISQNWY